MTDRVFAPGEREREEIDGRFREICSYAKLPHPLPEKFCNTAEIGIYANLCDDFRRYREKAISKEILKDRIQSHKTAHRKEYRSMKLKDEIYRRDQERFKLHSQTLAWLNKCDENTVALDEWESAIFTVLGCEYTEVEEKRLRRKWEIIRQRYREVEAPAPKKAKKAKQSKKKSELDFEALAKEYSRDERTLELLGQWYENRKAKRNIVNTENAIRQNLRRIEDFAQKSRLSVEKYLEEVVRLGWAAFYPVNSENTEKESVYSADASYDLSEFDKNIVGLKYAGENLKEV